MKYNDGKSSYDSKWFSQFCTSFIDSIIWGWNPLTYKDKFSALLKIDLENILSYLDKIINDLEWKEKGNVSKAIIYLKETIEAKEDISEETEDAISLTKEEIVLLMKCEISNWEFDEDFLKQLSIHLINEVLGERVYNKNSTSLRDAVKWINKVELEYLCKKVKEHKESILVMKEDNYTWDHDEVIRLLNGLISLND